MKKEDIEDIFSSMENFSSVPPPELWSQIEEKLDKPKKKKRAILWWSAAACLLLGFLLPSVLHFSSNSEIKNIENVSVKNNTVVLDEQKNDLGTKKTISTETNNNQNMTTEKNSVAAEDVVLPKNGTNSVNNALKNNQKTTVAQSDLKNTSNADVLNTKSDRKKNSNQSVTKRAFVTDHKNGFNSASQNQIADTDKKDVNSTLDKKSSVLDRKNMANSGLQKQIANADKKDLNSTLDKKSSVLDRKNMANSGLQNQIANADKKDINSTLDKKSSVLDLKNTANSGLQNQIANADRKTGNATLDKKSSVLDPKKGFNASSKNQIANADRKASDKILAEKTFAAGKTNPFNPTSKNQLSKSIFEDQSSSKNKGSLALNSAVSSNNQKVLNENNAKQNMIGLQAEKQIADHQKSNSKFIDVLSKQDSVQLAELQNLEKGIKTPEEKKEKDDVNPISNAEKWAVEVFAGVASSENYKNDKTLGNANSSKQSNSYGVKTKYKINKKWAVASGFKINELGQSVANVSYLSAKNNAFFSSSDYFNQNTLSAAPQITGNTDYVFVPNSTTNALKSNGIASSNIDSGNLDQNLRYIEMPLEVSYAIFTLKRASINLNTGGFVGKLISNNVALDGNSIGENVNANDYVYGSTLSSTLQYRVYKKTNIFVEPAMNYYINPLSNQSFNQFQWGLNFGLNVSF